MSDETSKPPTGLTMDDFQITHVSDLKPFPIPKAIRRWLEQQRFTLSLPARSPSFRVAVPQFRGRPNMPRRIR